MSKSLGSILRDALRSVASVFGLGSLVQDIEGSLEDVSENDLRSMINDLYLKGVRKYANNNAKLDEINNRLASIDVLSTVPGLRDRLASVRNKLAKNFSDTKAKADIEYEQTMANVDNARNRMLMGQGSYKQIADQLTKDQENVPKT